MRAFSVVSVLLLCLALVFMIAAGCDGARSTSPQPLGVGDMKLSGPYTHQNMTIFLIHGKETLPGKHFITLAEAIDNKKVVVHETGDVNNLQIENVGDDDVWVQSGDIVKGGKQDRTFANDCIIHAKSGKVAMNAFCVEQGRWTKRAGEDLAAFNASSAQVSGNAMKRAVQYGDQGAVWSNVADNQAKLSKSIGASAQSEQSASSFQLTLEKKEVVQSVESYTKPLAAIAADQPDVIGYALAVNGKVSSIDVYGNHALFIKLWPKLLNSAAVESIAEYDKDKKFAAAGARDVQKIMDSPKSGKEIVNKDAGKKARIVARDGDASTMSETLDAATAAPAHSNWLAK